MRYVGYVFKYEKKEEKPLLGEWSLDHSGESPSFLVPCLKPIAPCAPSPPSPLYPLSRQQDIYFHIDDNNMPARFFLVGHSTF
jgi:hypothetical protein